MILQGIKLRIGANLVVLLSVGMLLLNFVIVIAMERIMARMEISKGKLIISFLESQIAIDHARNFIFFDSGFEEQFDKIVSESDYSCALIIDNKMKTVYLSGKRCFPEDEIKILSKHAYYMEKTTVRFFDSTWGVFVKQRNHFILSGPLSVNGRTVGAVSLIYHLSGIYKILRNTQRVFFLYILLNTILLSIIGLYQLWKISFKPLQRMLKRVDHFTIDNTEFMIEASEYNEFNRLSNALNRMLKRISDDKASLHSTVASLEDANQQLKDAQREVIRAEKLASVGRLSSGIAHEIGNPIGIIMGYIELLKRKDISEEERIEFIERIESEVNRIHKIIKELLDFSRPSERIFRIASVHDILHDLIEMLKIQPIVSNIRFRYNPKATQDTVFADPDQLKQVFINLIINAVDAVSSIDGSENRCITIQTENQASSENSSKMILKIDCTDNGIGIASEHLDNIFDPFYTTKEPGKGTGLGLSVSFRIIESMGGKIEVYSLPNQGTTFSIFVPVSLVNAEKIIQ